VTLTPGHFIRDGLEFIESTARRVFDDLSRLDHAVVCFDECDELFRDRTTNEQGFRNILSFATASMLPKLQGLHDDRKVVVMVGTNFLHRIDPAIRRAGRFDHMLLVDRPDADARRGFLSREISGLTPSELDNLVKSSRGATAGELSAIAKAYPRPLSVSLAEYGEWCKDVGGRELKVASMPDDQRSAVAARWKAIVTDAKV